jgi:hypothetical protein
MHLKFTPNDNKGEQADTNSDTVHMWPKRELCEVGSTDHAHTHTHTSHNDPRNAVCCTNQVGEENAESNATLLCSVQITARDPPRNTVELPHKKVSHIKDKCKFGVVAVPVIGDCCGRLRFQKRDMRKFVCLHAVDRVEAGRGGPGRGGAGGSGRGDDLAGRPGQAGAGRGGSRRAGEEGAATPEPVRTTDVIPPYREGGDATTVSAMFAHIPPVAIRASEGNPGGSREGLFT